MEPYRSRSGHYDDVYGDDEDARDYEAYDYHSESLPQDRFSYHDRTATGTYNYEPAYVHRDGDLLHDHSQNFSSTYGSNYYPEDDTGPSPDYRYGDQPVGYGDLADAQATGYPDALQGAGAHSYGASETDRVQYSDRDSRQEDESSWSHRNDAYADDYTDKYRSRDRPSRSHRTDTGTTDYTDDLASRERSSRSYREDVNTNGYPDASRAKEKSSRSHRKDTTADDYSYSSNKKSSKEASGCGILHCKCYKGYECLAYAQSQQTQAGGASSRGGCTCGRGCKEGKGCRDTGTTYNHGERPAYRSDPRTADKKERREHTEKSTKVPKHKSDTKSHRKPRTSSNRHEDYVEDYQEPDGYR